MEVVQSHFGAVIDVSITRYTLTEVLGTGIEVVPNLPKYQSIGYRY